MPQPVKNQRNRLYHEARRVRRRRARSKLQKVGRRPGKWRRI